MSDTRRISPLGLYHIYNRGNNKDIIFRDELDKCVFLSLIKKYQKEYEIIIYAYCIMDNHFHLFIYDVLGFISAFMRDVQARYAEYFNNRYESTGHVFQGPFYNVCVWGLRHQIQLIRYILRNPIEAGIIKLVSQYKWSSLGISNLEYKLVKSEDVEIIFERTNTNFIEYIGSDEDTGLISIFEKKKYSDKEAEIKFREILMKEGIILEKGFLKLDEMIKMRVLSKCRYYGISVNQLQQITGATTHFIQKWIAKKIQYL